MLWTRKPPQSETINSLIENAIQTHNALQGLIDITPLNNEDKTEAKNSNDTEFKKYLADLICRAYPN